MTLYFYTFYISSTVMGLSGQRHGLVILRLQVRGQVVSGRAFGNKQITKSFLQVCSL